MNITELKAKAEANRIRTNKARVEKYARMKLSIRCCFGVGGIVIVISNSAAGTNT